MAARAYESERERIQQRSWIPDFGLGSGSSQRTMDLRRKSRRAIRPWRSAAARRRWEEEGSVERRLRLRGEGVKRTEVMKGEREGEEVEEGGGGRGKVEINWRERASTMEMEEPEGKARRFEDERSREEKLLREGGPGRIVSVVVVLGCDLERDIVFAGEGEGEGGEGEGRGGTCSVLHWRGEERRADFPSGVSETMALKRGVLFGMGIKLLKSLFFFF